MRLSVSLLITSTEPGHTRLLWSHGGADGVEISPMPGPRPNPATASACRASRSWSAAAIRRTTSRLASNESSERPLGTCRQNRSQQVSGRVVHTRITEQREGAEPAGEVPRSTRPGRWFRCRGCRPHRVRASRWPTGGAAGRWSALHPHRSRHGCVRFRHHAPDYCSGPGTCMWSTSSTCTWWRSASVSPGCCVPSSSTDGSGRTPRSASNPTRISRLDQGAASNVEPLADRIQRPAVALAVAAAGDRESRRPEQSAVQRIPPVEIESTIAKHPGE